MKKTPRSLIVFAVAALLFLEAAPSAFAFQAVLLPNQTLKVTQGEVLGKEDESGGQSGSSQSNSGKTESSEAPRPAEQNKSEAERKAHEAQEEATKRAIEARLKSSGKSPVNPILPAVSTLNKKIRLSVEDNKGRLEVIDKAKTASRSAKSPEIERENETETHQDGQFEDRFVKLELLNAANRQSSPSATAPQLQRRKPEDTPHPEDGTVTIQTPPSQEVPQQLEIQSRQTRSLVQPGSDVTVDPRTNEINVTDQNGQEQPLQRLPDQAFQDLTSKGAVFPDHYDEAKANLIIQTKDDGSVIYHTEVTDQRKMFGFIPYKVKVSHEVNDKTGEVTTQDLPDTSLFGRFRKLLGQ